jgi:hypothetical protein
MGEERERARAGSRFLAALGMESLRKKAKAKTKATAVGS